MLALYELDFLRVFRLEQRPQKTRSRGCYATVDTDIPVNIFDTPKSESHV